MLVLYIILFIASIFFYILYVGSFSFYLFAFLLVMPIILFVMLKKMSKKISVGFVNTQKTAGRSSKIPVVLRLQNRSKLPVANMIIEIEYYNTQQCLDNLRRGICRQRRQGVRVLQQDSSCIQRGDF